MSQTFDVKIPRLVDYVGSYSDTGTIPCIGFVCLNEADAGIQYGYKFNLAYSSNRYNLSGLTDLGTGQTLTLPFSISDGHTHSIAVAFIADDYYTITVTLADSLALTFCNGLVYVPAAASSGSGNGSSASVDLSPVIELINALDVKVSSSNTTLANVSNGITSLSASVGVVSGSCNTLLQRVPTDLTGRLTSLSTSVADISSGGGSGGGGATLPAGLTPIDITNLGGHYSKFIPGDVVFYGLYGLWEVVKVSLCLSDENHYQPYYQVKQNMAPNGSPAQYRYNVVPQSALNLYVPPPSVVTEIDV